MSIKQIALAVDAATAATSLIAAFFWIRAARTLPQGPPPDGKPGATYFHIAGAHELREARAQAVANQRAALCSAVAAALLALSTALHAFVA